MLHFTKMMQIGYSFDTILFYNKCERNEDFLSGQKTPAILHALFVTLMAA